jgi:hypothetical protein
MALQEVNPTQTDGALGFAPSNGRKRVAILGTCVAGTAATVYAYTDKDTLIAAHTGGPAVEAACEVLDTDGFNGEVLFVPVNGSTAAASGAVTAGGSSPPTLTPSGVPRSSYQWLIRVVTAGTLGTMQFQYSIDNGDTWSAVITSAASYVVPGTGVTLGFAAGSYLTTHTYAFESTAATYGTSDFNAAMAALIADPRVVKIGFLVGQPAGVDDAARSTACAAMAAAASTQLSSAANSKKWMRLLIQSGRPLDDATSSGRTTWRASLITAFASFADSRVAVAAGDIELQSAVGGGIFRRGAAFPIFGRIAKNPISQDISAFEDGPLNPRVRAIYHDERAEPQLDDGRFIVLRRYVGEIGFYISNPWTMALSTSDYSMLQNGLVVDEATRIAYSGLLKYLSRKLAVSATTGRILENEAKDIESQIGGKLRAGLVQPGDALDVSLLVNRTDNILSTRKFRAKVRISGWAYPKAIDVEIGFQSPTPIAIAA